MIIRHNLPFDKYTKLDRYVMVQPDLSDGAKVLYAYLCGLRNGAAFSDSYITKAMRLSQAALTRRKKELKDAGLILVEQLSAKVYVVYIGHSRLSAKQVKANWANEDDVLGDRIVELVKPAFPQSQQAS